MHTTYNQNNFALVGKQGVVYFLEHVSQTTKKVRNLHGDNLPTEVVQVSD